MRDARRGAPSSAGAARLPRPNMGIGPWVWFDSWYSVVRVIVTGAFAYTFLVLLLRVSGKRTLSKLNAFDLIVTVAIGSTLATVTTSSDVSATEGAAVFVLLCGAQFLVTKLSVRVRAVAAVVRAEPALLVRHGRIDDSALDRNRVTPGEVRQAVRSSGHGAVEDVAAVVLETDGTMSVIGVGELGSGSALDDLSF